MTMIKGLVGIGTLLVLAIFCWKKERGAGRRMRGRRGVYVGSMLVGSAGMAVVAAGFAASHDTTMLVVSLITLACAITGAVLGLTRRQF